MCNYLKQLKTSQKLVFGLILGIVGLLLAGSVFAYTNYLFIDWFNEYDIGPLRDQGGWSHYGYGWEVQDDYVFEGAKAIKCEITTGESCSGEKTVNQSDTGKMTAMVYIEDQETNKQGMRIELYQGGTKKLDFSIQEVEGEMRVYGETFDFAYIQIGTITTFGAWFPVEIEWANGSPDSWRFRWEDNDWTEWYEGRTWSYLDKVGLSGTMAGSPARGIVFIDTIDKEIVELEMIIQGLLPESGTEITDLDQNLIVKYQGFDWEIYSGFVVNFRDDKIGGLGNSQGFIADDLNPAGTGQVEVNLQDFEFDTNGQWHLTGSGFGTHLDIEGGMFLTTRGYIDFWTEELVSPSYYLTINVEALPTPYTFTDPDDWYSTSVLRFDTPTGFFTSFVGLMTPVFEKVGEFGIRTQTMFDQKEAYDKGYALGEIFPLINGYIEKIDLFFGGFPLASFLKYLILVMSAIFIVRTVMKFIPFLG